MHSLDTKFYRFSSFRVSQPTMVCGFYCWIILNILFNNLWASSGHKLAYRSWKLISVSRLVATRGASGQMDGSPMRNHRGLTINWRGRWVLWTISGCVGFCCWGRGVNVLRENKTVIVMMNLNSVWLRSLIPMRWKELTCKVNTLTLKLVFVLKGEISIEWDITFNDTLSFLIERSLFVTELWRIVLMDDYFVFSS